MRVRTLRSANALHGNDRIKHLRADITKIDEPKAQALFETAAEVISGVDTAFKHYEDKSEEAWK
jgi:hypothetical protein